MGNVLGRAVYHASKSRREKRVDRQRMREFATFTGRKRLLWAIHCNICGKFVAHRVLDVEAVGTQRAASADSEFHRTDATGCVRSVACHKIAEV